MKTNHDDPYEKGNRRTTMLFTIKYKFIFIKK